MCSLSNFFFTEQSVFARSSCLPVSFVFSIPVLLLFILQNYVFCVYHIRCGIRYLFSIYCCWHTPPLPVHAANKSSQKWLNLVFPLALPPSSNILVCLFQMSLSRGLSLFNGKCGSYVKLPGKPWLKRLPLQVNLN